MKIVVNLIITSITTIWMVTLAVFSIQNITLVSLKFLSFESIQIPIGVLLSFSAGSGMILGALFPLLWYLPGKTSRRSFKQDEIDDLGEFDF